MLMPCACLLQHLVGPKEARGLNFWGPIQQSHAVPLQTPWVCKVPRGGNTLRFLSCWLLESGAPAWPQNQVLAFNEMETKLIFLLFIKTAIPPGREGFSGDGRASSTLTARCCPARPVFATVLYLWQQKGRF